MVRKAHSCVARGPWCRIIALLVAVVFTPRLAVAQDGSTVTGQVVSGAPPRPVAAAVIDAAGTSVVTAADGTFTLTAPLGPTRISVSAPGFLTARLDLVVIASTPPLEIQLQPTPDLREAVVVSGRTDDGGGAPPLMVLGPAEVNAVAGAADNVFRVLQTLPGVGATDDFGSRLTVRGGGPDQNLTVMDGVEIHNPYRLFGLTSAFNPETVESFALTAGGFSAKYGDRLSSILILNNREGSTTEALTGTATMSITDTNAVFEGKLPGGLRGSWLVTGRRTYYDVFAERVTHNDLPSFNDVQVRGVWDPKPGMRLAIFGLRSRESTDASFDKEDGGDWIGIFNASSNDVASVSLSSNLGGRISSKTVVSWYGYGDELGVDGALRNSARRSNRASRSSVGITALAFKRTLSVRDVSARQEVTIAAGTRHVLEAGADLHTLNTTWGWRIDGDRNTGAANPSSTQGGSALPARLDSSRDNIRAGVWLQDRYRVSSRFRLEPGVRIDWSGLGREVSVSPRGSATLDLSPATRLRVAGGLFTQSPGYEKLLQSDYFVDLSDANGLNLSSERAVHVIGTLEHDIGPGLTGRLELYSKAFDRMIVGRLETPDENAARVAEYNFPAAISDSIPTARAITAMPINGATGHAYGFDLFMEKKATSAADAVSGWLSYTWGKATTTSYGRTYPLDYDRRHAVSAVMTARLRPRLELGATLRMASGLPSTLPVRVRVDSALADGAVAGAPGSLVPARDSTGAYVWAADFGGPENLNSTRAPLYARLDLRVTFGPARANGRWQIYVEALNVLNRKNASRLDPELDYDSKSDRPKISYSRNGGLPVLPAFGVRFRF